MADICPNCPEPLDLGATRCLACGADAGAPNVRIAQRREEVVELERRARDAAERAKQARAEDTLARFSDLARASKMVIARRPRVLTEWALDPDRGFTNFWQARAEGLEIPDDPWNRARAGFENMVAPMFFDRLHWGALTIDDHGMDKYGACNIVFRDAGFADRATVFEENPALFGKRHEVVTGDEPKPGFRAVWAERERLAVAKLGDKLRPRMTDCELADLLMGPDRASDDCDYIEVHVHGALSFNDVERIHVARELTETERGEWMWLREKLVSLGVSC